MALHWAAADNRVRTVVAVAPYDQPDQAIYRFVEMQKAAVPKRLLRRAVEHAASRLKIEWEDWAATTAMRGISQPVLLIGGDHDTISQPDDIRALESMASGEVRAVVLPGIDHIVVAVSVEALEEPIKEWLRQHLATE